MHQFSSAVSGLGIHISQSLRKRKEEEEGDDVLLSTDSFHEWDTGLTGVVSTEENDES